MAQSVMDQIDKGLERLYKLKGEEYDNVFRERCEENGFDDDESIQEEMENEDGLEESQLADDDFLEGLCPWLKSKGDQRRAEIFEILLKCYKDPKAYTNAYEASPSKLTVAADDFSVKKQDIEKAKALAKKQAPSLFDGGFANDNGLCYMLAVTMKMKENYLQYLVDMFLREKLYHHYRASLDEQKDVIKPDFTESTFQEKNHHICKTLKNIPNPGGQKEVFEVAVGAVKSYLHRVAPKLLFTRMDRIKYPYRAVAQYVLQTIEFVNQVATTQENSCPFQYDSVFAFQETTAEEVEDDGDDDDDDESENGDGNGNDESSVRKSQLGDIKECLVKTQLRFKSANWSNPEVRMFRPLGEQFQTLKSEAVKDHKSHKFPQHNRFCSVLDLRKDPENDEKADDNQNDDNADHNLFVFQPEENSRTIHQNATSLNYFHNIKHSIIPCTDEPNGDEDEDEQRKEPKLASGTNGPQIMLSFQVEQEDDMRCYLFINGNCTRFLPEDLKMLLPLFFDLTKSDTEFINSKEMDRMIQSLDGKLRDDKFRSFLSENKVICPYKMGLSKQPAVAQ